jgi:membrane protease YdiL (CAAX protease family)
MTPRRSTQLALAVLAGHNLVQNHLLNEEGYVAGNLAVSAALIGLGRISGLNWDDMGLSPAAASDGLRLGAVVSAGAVVAAALGLVHPRSRRYLLDERAAPADGGSVWRRALIRFPVGTALFEEVAFRGVIPALLRHRHRPNSADLLAAGAFSAWHLIPTARALSGNPLGQGMRPGPRLAAIVGGSVLAGAFGLFFTALRRRSGSLLAPWLTHASLNTFSYLTATAAWKLAPLVTSSQCPGRLPEDPMMGEVWPATR